MRQVLSLALPPPPELFPALGWSPPSAPTSARDAGGGSYAGLGLPARPAASGAESVGDAGGVNTTISTTALDFPAAAAVVGAGCQASARDVPPPSILPSSPLILFPRSRPTPEPSRPSARSAANELCSRNGGGSDGAGTATGGCGGGYWVGVATERTTGRGRGVIAATRGGRPLLLETHPADAPPSPPPALLNPPSSLQPPPRPPPSAAPSACRGGPNRSNGSGVSGVSGAPASAAAAASPNSLEFHGPSSSSSKKRVSAEDAPLTPRSGVQGVVLVERHTRAGSTGSCGANGSSAASAHPCSEPSPAKVAAAAASRTLGSMCKRGVLVRAKREMSCLSVVGVRFVKAATWCKNCGLVSGHCIFRTHKKVSVCQVQTTRD